MQVNVILTRLDLISIIEKDLKKSFNDGVAVSRDFGDQLPENVTVKVTLLSEAPPPKKNGE